MTHGELDFYRSGHLDPHTPTGRRLAGGEHVSVSMGTLGYRYVQRAGDSRVVSLGFWSLWAAEAPYAYAVLVQAWPQWALVWLPGLPDMLTYLSLYGNVGQGVRGGRGGAPVAPPGAGFRAWHGHEVYGA